MSEQDRLHEIGCQVTRLEISQRGQTDLLTRIATAVIGTEKEAGYAERLRSLESSRLVAEAEKIKAAEAKEEEDARRTKRFNLVAAPVIVLLCNQIWEKIFGGK